MADPDRLPADTGVGRVRLRISNLDRSLEFYAGLLGWTPVDAGDTSTTLAAATGARPLVSLHAVPGTRPRPPSTLGLYHFALLFPDRSSFATTLHRLIDARWPFTGFSDHGVSEAAYLSDPDGLGIELYVDRPRSQWPRQDGRLAMFTRPLDLEVLLSAAPAAPARAGPAAHDVRMGHIHLHVRSIEKARAFYDAGLGFDVTVSDYPGALFLSAGGYHHHVGVNTWAGSRTAGPDAAGLLEWRIVVPEAGARAALHGRLEAQGVAVEESGERLRFSDPDGNVVVVARSA